MNHSNWIIREAQGADLPFIYSTWTNSYRYDSVLGKSCRNSVFFREYNKVIDHILIQPDTKVAVACSPANAEVIFGYMVYQPGIIHYAFTKEVFWRFGIQRSLLQWLGGAKIVTHRTNMIKPLLECHPELTYNPFLLFKQAEEQPHGSTEER